MMWALFQYGSEAFDKLKNLTNSGSTCLLHKNIHFCAKKFYKTGSETDKTQKIDEFIFLLVKLHHLLDVNTYPGDKLLRFIYIFCFLQVLKRSSFLWG